MNIIFLLCSVGLALSCTTPADQVSALKDLYTATNGAEWTHRTNWNSGDPCNNHWFGIACDSVCSIISLELDYNNLSGTIPLAIGNLSNLAAILDLSGGTIQGTIPSSISNLILLEKLLLHTNKLTGTIPTAIQNLSELVVLDLSTNSLEGTIPPSIVDKPPFIRLYLENNLLNGTVPFPAKPEVQNFSISNNRFSCPLPSWCSSPPVGDGLCSPCVNATTSKQFCCLYSTDACVNITASICSINTCSSIHGQELCGQIGTSDCSKCVISPSEHINIV